MMRLIALAAALATLAAAPPETKPMEHEARGRFEVTLTPEAAPAPALARLSIRKTFHGDLEGASVGEMLSAGAPATGSAGYVALEQVTGVLGGRSGGFALQHSGTMDGGRQSLLVQVAPGSGTGALAGIAGAMTIDVAAGHAYVLRYTLPGAR